MPQWALLVIVGLILFAVTYAPIFPAAWSRFVQALGGILLVVGLVLFVLGVLGVRA